MTRARREKVVVVLGGAVMLFGLGVTVGAAVEAVAPEPEVLRTYSVDCPTQESCEPVWRDGGWRIEEVAP